MNQTIRDMMISHCNALMSPYPQYKGHFDNFRLVVTNMKHRFKGGNIEDKTVTLAEVDLRDGTLRVTILRIAKDTVSSCCITDPLEIASILWL